MPGKPTTKGKTQKEEISELKQEFVRFYEKNGVKQAAADWIGRDMETVRKWERGDSDFEGKVLRAKATFYQNNRSRVRLDNLFANLYPDDFKPPKQELDVNLPTSITINHVHAGNNDTTDTEAR